MARVLIVTNEQDLAADLVVLELHRRGIEVLRCNTERVTEWRATCEPGRRWQLTDHLGRSASSEGVSGVWWRRPEPPVAPISFASGDERAAFVAQWQALLESLASVPGPQWISPPAAIRTSEDKALQLATAARIGFDVPATTWTNLRPEPIGDTRVVVKPVTTAAWTDDDGAAFVFAQLVERSDLPQSDELSVMPMAFQVPVLPKVDVRVTVIEHSVLAAAPVERDDPSAPLDWRLQPDRRWGPYALSDDLQERCRALVAALGLRFGGIDLAIDDDGIAWFLEINPNGEWGWLAQQAKLPIVERLCDALTNCERADA
jgi:hypothetical protein